MALDEKLTARVRELIVPFSNDIEEKKMFGGICFMVNGKMCIGVKAERIMVRFDPLQQEEVLGKEGCMPMDMKNKTMKGFVFVDTQAVTTKSKLNYWVKLALDYNHFAPEPKRKRNDD